MSELQGKYVKIENTDAFYITAGSGPPVVCIHPVGANSQIFKRLLLNLSDLGYKGIAPDLPGHGHSYPVNWQPMDDVKQIASWVRKFCDSLTDTPTSFIGNALGGLIVLQIGLDYPDICDNILSISGVLRTPKTGDLNWARQPSGCPSWQDRMERLAIDGLHNPSEDTISEMRWIHRATGQQTAVADDEAWLKFDLGKNLQNISCPLMIAVGENDYYVPTDLRKKTKREMPDQGTYMTLADMGHYPVIENPEYVCKVFDEFINSNS